MLSLMKAGSARQVPAAIGSGLDRGLINALRLPFSHKACALCLPWATAGCLGCPVPAAWPACWPCSRPLSPVCCSGPEAPTWLCSFVFLAVLCPNVWLLILCALALPRLIPTSQRPWAFAFIFCPCLIEFGETHSWQT